MLTELAILLTICSTSSSIPESTIRAATVDCSTTITMILSIQEEHPEYIEKDCPPIGWDGEEYQGCPPRACDFGDDSIDVVIAYGQAHVNAVGKFFVDIAAWVVGHETETMLCFPARGYDSREDIVTMPGFPANSTKATFHGHVLSNFAETDVGAEDFANIHTPGTYWMDGGTMETISEGCFPVGDGGKSCPFDTTIKAEGKFYDVCYELARGLGIDIETHCDDIETSLECNKVNTCKWSANACQYTADKRTIGAKSSKRHV